MLTLNTDPIHGSLPRKASLSFQERCDYVVRYRRRKKTTAFSSLTASGGCFHVGGAETYIRVTLRSGLLYAAKQSHAPLLRTPQREMCRTEACDEMTAGVTTPFVHTNPTHSQLCFHLLKVRPDHYKKVLPK